MQLLERAGPNAWLQVRMNGAKKVHTTVFAKNDGDPRILACDEVNLSSSKDRQSLVENIPASFKEEVLELAVSLAHQIVGAQAIEKEKPRQTKPPEPTPFKIVEPTEEPVDGEELLARLSALFERYMVLPRHAIEPIVLWILHSYLSDVADYSPYLHVTSPTRECGKSTLLDLLFRTAHRALLTSGITAAALYRTVEKWSPSMLLDELDTRLRGENAEILRGVLNSGFERKGRITICVGDGHEVRDFPTFCPEGSRGNRQTAGHDHVALNSDSSAACQQR
jgi:hypothetical protein